MGYDAVIPYLGEFGRYQKRIYFLLCLPAILCAFHKLAGPFLLATPDHRCQLPFEHSNVTYNISTHIKNLSYPIEPLKDTYSSCEYLNATYDEEYLNGNVPANKAISCNKWVYDKSVYLSSTVTEWDMVCSQNWLRATADAIFMVGVMLGSIVFGDLADRFGRLPIFFASLVIQVVFGIAVAISPEYITYSASRLIVGATTSGVFLVAYVIGMEMVGPKYRTFAGICCMMFFSVGYMMTAGFAYFFRDWRTLQIALTLPGLAFLCYWWFIPESVRWLLSQNRKQEAIEIIQKAAKENKVTVPQDVLDNLIEPQEKRPDDESKPSLFDLFRYPNLRKKSLLIFFNWFVNSGTYYGLSWNTGSLGGHYLISFVISGFVEIPAYTFIIFTLDRWGRRNILAGCMITAGIVLLLTGFIPDSQPLLLVSLAMLGKLAITASYGCIYVFSAEQFPTVVRNVGLGAASTCARIGGIMAPYFNLLSDIWKPFPLIIFGALALTGGTLSFLLPETLNKKLPETIADGEQFGKRGKDGESNAEELKVLNVPNDQKEPEAKTNGLLHNED